MQHQSSPLTGGHAGITFQNMDILQAPVYDDNLIFTHENRPKSQNFHDRERHVLLDLIMKKTDIIENKRNDIDMITKKDQIWNKTTLLFNSNPTVNQRDIKQLKACWKNMKSKARKIVADSHGTMLAFDQYDTVSPKVLEVLTQVHDVLSGKISRDDATQHDDAMQHDEGSTDIIIKQEVTEAPSSSVNQQNDDEWQVHFNLDSSDEPENSTQSESVVPPDSTPSEKLSKDTAQNTSDTNNINSLQDAGQDIPGHNTTPDTNTTPSSDTTAIFKITSISNPNTIDPDHRTHLESYESTLSTQSGAISNQHVFNRRPILGKRPAKIAVLPEQAKRTLLQSMKTHLHEDISPPIRVPFSHVGGSHGVYSIPDIGYSQRMGAGPVFPEGCSQEHLNARLLEMAEAEHRKKMRILDIEEEVLVLKRRKIQQSIDNF